MFTLLQLSISLLLAGAAAISPPQAFEPVDGADKRWDAPSDIPIEMDEEREPGDRWCADFRTVAVARPASVCTWDEDFVPSCAVETVRQTCELDTYCVSGYCSSCLASEVCGNELDENCDGVVDDGCE